MATLSEAAYYSRKFIKYGLIVVALYVVARIGYFMFTRWWQETHPVKPPPPQSEFGKLPQLPFPLQEKPNFRFSLQTISGTTGEFDEQQKVYLMPTKRANLLALEKATELAGKMGFLFEPSQISETQYLWSKDDPLPSSLNVDIITDHFFFKAEWRVRPDLLVGVVAPSQQESINLARSWLHGLDLLPKDISLEDAQVDYLKVTGTEIVPALSQSEAQFVQVRLSRSPVEELTVWPTDLDQNLISVTYIPSIRREIEVIEAEYKYLPVEYDQSGSYPVITSQQAWELLQAGEGYYAFMPVGFTNIPIRKITLGYYEPPISGFFLQPIYVFEGDGGFVGYILAVIDEWITSIE